eukprot:8267447-Heterocapsa_arctica.AAC.1
MLMELVSCVGHPRLGLNRSGGSALHSMEWLILGLQNIKQRRTKEENKPACFWMGGIVLSDWTNWPDTENMKAMEVCHPYRGKVKK